ncbi:malonate transporter subunit MadM [Mariniflexile jejuense]|uniref:Malonate transporter subunit MadM n=1 Tax=Mariniflexile jejuense TaxID=1173582 RepID=A0ABW3JPF5_9FLAO
MLEILENIIDKNGLIFAFLCVGFLMLFSFWISKHILKNYIPSVAIAIIIALGLAFFGSKNGLGNVKVFAGLSLLGGSMFRDFAVVATAMNADIAKIKAAGFAGSISLIVGVSFSFSVGALLSFLFGYTDIVSITTIGAGACTYIVGPITGYALGATSEVIAISIATGVVKTIFVTIMTPLLAKGIGLNNPHSAIVFGGLMGTTSGVAAGLAATDVKLVPYGAMAATFYTGLGCLLCPSFFYLIIDYFLK